MRTEQRGDAVATMLIGDFMTPTEIKTEHQILKAEYEALKRFLGEMLLEHSDDSAQDDLAYYTRKFNEARERLKRQV